MNDKLPRLKAREIERALRRDGWALEGQKGSHRQFTHATKPGKVTVPFHQGRDVSSGTLRSILAQANLSVDELRELL